MLKSNQHPPIKIEPGTPTREAIILFFVLGFALICSACVKNDTVTDADLQSSQIELLPSQLQVSPLSFDKILQSYDWLNDKQKIITLQYVLGHNTITTEQKAEAAYMLARLFQPLAKEETLSLYDLAQTYPPLKLKSLWHKSEIAAVLGKEKLVRQALTAFLAEIKDPIDIAAAQYALGQSYIRAGESNNACKLFSKIRTDFSKTEYAIGASYYLGTLAYSQFTQKIQNPHKSLPTDLFQFNNQKSAPDLLKDTCTYYFEYLKASPVGHFTPDILLKLENLTAHNFWQAKERELVLMAPAYSAIGHYQASYACWQRAGINKHLLAVSRCLFQMGQLYPAKEKFFSALANGSKDTSCLALANDMGSHFNRTDSLHFWQQLHSSKFAFQDEVLWNIAIRKSAIEAANYYQDILKYYPQSIHAPEAQWWILWHEYKLISPRLAITLPNLFYKAAIKYSHDRLTPRFLFWAGKISEKVNDKRGASFYYQQVLKLHSTNYYELRAMARLNFLTNNTADDFFKIRYYSNNTIEKDLNDNEKTPTASAIWNYPPPQKTIDTLRQKGELTLYELIYIKQYAEVLADYKLPAELTAWLAGKCGQSWLAINTASLCLEDNNCPVSDSELLSQYSFPLLYSKEIIANCAKTKVVNPLLVQALVREESRYNPNAVSQAQALGLCQLMPATASGIAKNAGIKFNNKLQLFQPSLNLRLGISYLASALTTFNNEALLAIASYNAGINAVKNFLGNQQINSFADPDQFVEDFPFRETRGYLRKVFSSYWHYKQIYHL